MIESATKYLNGHADVIAGVVAGNTEFMQKVGLDMSCNYFCRTHMLLNAGVCLRSVNISHAALNSLAVQGEGTACCA